MIAHSKPYTKAYSKVYTKAYSRAYINNVTVRYYH